MARSQEAAVAEAFFATQDVVSVAPEDDDGEAAHARQAAPPQRQAHPHPVPTPEAAVADTLAKHRLVVAKRIKDWSTR